jgi:mannose-6-phosphate isomerase-like protein (cupin superfamily)
MMRPVALAVLASLLFTLPVAGMRAQSTQGAAQTPPPPAGQTPPQAAAPKPQTPPRTTPAAPATTRTSAAIMVTDQSGAAVSEVRITVTGPVSREGTTGRDGTLRLSGLRAGTYRLRFESADFITLERDVTIKAGPDAEIDVALDRGAPKPKVAEPETPPVARTAAGGPTSFPDPNATVERVALPDWIERNLIGRSDPVKETTVGKTPVTTATIVQVREPLKDRLRNDADEMLYIIAGEGALRAKGRELVLDAGALVVVPRGVAYSIERRGRNPLIALSIVGK